MLPEPRKASDSLNELVSSYRVDRNTAVRNRIIELLYPLVEAIATRIYFREYRDVALSSYIDKGELINVGILALTEALLSFDFRYGTKFTTWVYPRVRGDMIDYIRRLYRTDKSHLPSIELDQEFDGAYSDDIDQGLVASDIWIVIKGLPSHHRQFSLLTWKGYNVREISEFMGISKARVYQIRNEIRIAIVAAGLAPDSRSGR